METLRAERPCGPLPSRSWQTLVIPKCVMTLILISLIALVPLQQNGTLTRPTLHLTVFIDDESFIQEGSPDEILPIPEGGDNYVNVEIMLPRRNEMSVG